MEHVFELPPELNIYNVLETRDAMLAWVTQQVNLSHDMLKISAKNVNELDGSGLQLLAALSNMEHHWTLVDASPVFVNAVRTLGLNQWLDKRLLQSLAEAPV